MNRSSQIIVLLILLMFMAVAGYYIGYKHGYGWRMYLETIEQEHYQAFMHAQSQMGTLESKEEAIKQFIIITEKRRSSLSPTFTEKIYAVDLLLSYAKLAALAEKRGSKVESQEYFQQAESYCPKTGWQECSIEVIKQFVEKSDAIFNKQ